MRRLKDFKGYPVPNLFKKLKQDIASTFFELYLYIIPNLVVLSPEELSQIASNYEYKEAIPNLNSAITTGQYKVSSNVSHMHRPIDEDLMLIVMRVATSTIQYAIPKDGVPYVRSGGRNNWTEWVKLSTNL